ncbi:hypothetical protein ASD24_26765 [Paenibacillus sp. Root52]|uniref:hypothetical protein n=1 Tax=Paenibacillus sp. Root52 TaxID=1736552 RepID=UPI0006F9CD0F|nr:hypothetical protein [Paenibacillus sp. Root52]KQY87081.1 hypothetical protein ASD24_26765 [Paenibacillus sp. Root52]
MKLIQYPTFQSQPLEGIMPPIPLREFRGLNTFDPYSIEDSYLTEMKNMTNNDYPALSTRPGYTVIGANGSRVLGMGVWRGRELHVVFSDGTWRRWNGSSWATLASGLNTSAEWTFTNFDGNLGGVNLIGCNGVDTMRRYNGSTVSVLSGAPSNGKYITTYQNRLWCAVGNELWSSALDQPQNWNQFAGNQQDSYRRQMESTRGEDINMLSGSLSKLTIGMPGSLHELYGGIPADFNVRLITEDMGLSNNKSALTQEGFMRFMHRTGIYEYGGGTLPTRRFSEIIDKRLSNIGPDTVAGTDGRKLYFNIQPEQMMVYDPRSGVESWCEWNGIRAVQFAQMDNRLYVGDSSGRVLLIGGTTDAGSAIPWSATTKPFNGGSLAQKMRWYKMWVVVELTGSMEIHMSPSVTGDSDWTLVQSISGSPGQKVQRVIIPVRQFTLNNWVRVRFSGSGYVRIHEFTRQIRQLPLY